MSTEAQQYSLQNQMAAINEFAAANGFEIVHTYSDSGKSGLTLRNRPGIRALLRDVIGRLSNFRAVLIYDVSRWGRFQDPDEAGHYEFICRSNDVTVQYCAEPFRDSCTLSINLLKTIKRTMAAEFSRKLGADVFERKRFWVVQGLRVGGRAPFGLGRAIVSSDGKKCPSLPCGVHKSLASARVTIVPGPRGEVECVREIFNMLLRRRMGCSHIARELNHRGKLNRGHPWSSTSIHNVLTNPIYEGTNAWARTCQKLQSSTVHVPREQWIVKPGAFPSIVSPDTFRRAQLALHRRSAAKHWSDHRILESARALLQRDGTLSERALETGRSMPGSRTIRAHYGSYLQLYKRLGYRASARVQRTAASMKKTLSLRSQLMSQITEMFGSAVTVIRKPFHRQVLLVDGAIRVSIVICRMVRPTCPPTWKLVPNKFEKGNISLVCLANAKGDAVAQMFLLPKIAIRCTARRLRQGDSWLETSIGLLRLNSFCRAVRSLAGRTIGKLTSD